ncbi:MAG TPA: MarR family transcriptional regulator [Gammaproteobacteria bacterium]|jgi:predicted ArsR family transcriptional regulator|nr:transcriptional regulator [Pseudomonadales bacterium]MBT5718782.1 transcriptional regulator [Gammaproteobacteria bacterium]MBT6482721.1 transcriptional regulator [Gammaproteobacteria bacterium]MBT7227426.1 transcriptional regulator [Gammaproteobacteria bacterium]HAS49491.1 MarR family transcriptional regulator [Gammaproteobacteria bacterium]
MELPKSQDRIMQRLKTRGPQSVKILSKQLDMTTMGVRQHLAELESKGLVGQTQEERQTRGRPVHLWKLSAAGHGRFPDTHSQTTIEIIDVIRSTLGEQSLNQLIAQRSDKIEAQYREQLGTIAPELQLQIEKLAQLRSDEGYMAEVRLLPDGFMLIENHCPICTAATSCQQFCETELDLFQRLFEDKAIVTRTDHLLAGARRCAYKITAIGA